MTEPAEGRAPETRASGQGASAASRYRELAPRAPEHGFDLFEIFSSTDCIEMEIGFGRGMFLVQRAGAAPAASLLGIEIRDKLAYRVAKRCEQLGLARVRVMAGDARVLLPRVTPAGALTRAFLHFPDPWWKKRHAKRRLLAGSPLLDELARLLRPSGELFIQTDVEERAEECLAQLTAHPAFELPASGFVEHNPFGAVSNRERRAIEDGLPIYRILAVRRP